MVLISGALLLASLVASTALAAATDFLDIYLPGAAVSASMINFWFLLVVTFLVFALMYKFTTRPRFFTWEPSLHRSMAAPTVRSALSTN
jgi:hypothetical protein